MLKFLIKNSNIYSKHFKSLQEIIYINFKEK